MRAILSLLALLAAVCDASVIPRALPPRVRNGLSHSTREVTLDDRLNCTAGLPDGDQPAIRTNTTVQVNQLIIDMTAQGYEGYVVVMGDAHQSEYADNCEERVNYISGFSGSAGVAVILASGNRALWSDGRYFIQGDEQLGCEWLFMMEGEEGVPTVTEWLSQELSSDSLVGADARLASASNWLNFNDELNPFGISTVPDTITNGENLLDVIWRQDQNSPRPACSNAPIFEHPVQYAGVSWQQKIADIEVTMADYGTEAYVITMLDETAWTLNVRGADIPYNPVFPSYILVDTSAGSPTSVTLFIKDQENKVPPEVMAHLGIGNCTAACVTLVDYDSIETALTNLNSNPAVTKVLLPSAYDSPGVSYFIYNLINETKRLSVPSPVFLSKAMKNPTESAAMRNAHLKDAVALMTFMQLLETEIPQGVYWDELTAQDELDRLRSLQDAYVSLSFNTISAYGPNGAIIHYASEPATNVQIGTDSLYMVDSGGQYMDGTTDVTRTMFFGNTTADADPKMVEAYTRVLMGQVDFAMMVFPAMESQYYIDVEARKSLYSVGWDYRHGTSHGVGMLLNVHEGSDFNFQLGWFGSDEPGYYEDGEFGLRLENIVTCVEVETKYDFTEVSYGLETVTLVPYVPKLIDLTLLTTAQCNWVNDFHQMIRDKTSAELLSQGLPLVNDWMIEKTEPLACL